MYESEPSSDLSDLSQVFEAADIFIFWLAISGKIRAKSGNCLETIDD